jgi:hypothetical protein
MKATGIFLSGFFAALVVVAVSALIWERKRIVKVHILTQPWIISSNQSDRALHTLPPGTTLYFDKGFPEGFSRYKVYVNVDRMPLALRDLPDRNEIDPLDARPFDNHAPDDAFQE